MILCEYGCGKEAKFPPCKGKPKWSCEDKNYKCLALRKRYGSPGEKNPMHGKKHSKKTKKLISEKATGKSHKRENYIPYNKGKTLLEIHGEKRAREIKEKRSKSVIKAIKEGKCKIFHKNYKHLTGYFITQKNDNKKVYYASSYELAACRIFEEDEKTLVFNRYNMSIPYLYKGIIRRYIPDFYIIHKKLGILLLEIKPLYQCLDPINQAKWKMARIHCYINNMKFGVSTEKQLGPIIKDIYDCFKLTP